MTSAALDSLMIEAHDRARRVGISADLMAVALVAARGSRPYVTEIETKPGGDFFRVTQEGPSRVLYLNHSHPFYETIYDPPGSTLSYRSAIEVFLWVLGTSALDATESDRAIYVQEQRMWSHFLRQAAPILDELLGYPDERAALAADEVDEDEPVREYDGPDTVAEKNGER
jgi:hypothetical protein